MVKFVKVGLYLNLKESYVGWTCKPSLVRKYDRRKSTLEKANHTAVVKKDARSTKRDLNTWWAAGCKAERTRIFDIASSGDHLRSKTQAKLSFWSEKIETTLPLL